MSEARPAASRAATDARPGTVVSIATAEDLLQWHPHLHVLTTDGVELTRFCGRVSAWEAGQLMPPLETNG
jgi:hypothetical protein